MSVLSRFILAGDLLVFMCAAGRDVRPAAQLLSFAWPKESNQRKGHPHSPRPLRGNLRYVLLAGERSNSLRSDNRAPDPAKSTQRRRVERGTPDADSQQPNSQPRPGRAGHRALGAMGRTAPPIPIPGVPLCMRRGAQLQADKGWRCLSAASLARPRRQRAPQGPVALAEGADSGGSLSFGDFSLAAQRKVTAPPGAHPGLPVDTPSRSGKTHLKAESHYHAGR